MPSKRKERPIQRIRELVTEIALKWLNEYPLYSVGAMSSVPITYHLLVWLVGSNLPVIFFCLGSLSTICLQMYLLVDYLNVESLLNFSGNEITNLQQVLQIYQ